MNMLRQVFEGIFNRNGDRVVANDLTPAEKKRRVVLKRCNLDAMGVRPDFLRAGTIAKARISPFT